MSNYLVIEETGDVYHTHHLKAEHLDAWREGEYGAGTGLCEIFDITDPAEPKRLSSAFGDESWETIYVLP
jgi:hypothetical protein